MQSSSVFETIVGAIVIAIAVLFVVFVYNNSGHLGAGGYEVSARFNRADGVSVGTDVRMSGIKIGQVEAMDLDPKTFMAVLHLNIAGNVKLPQDSSVRITSEGLLGGNYLSIEPGGEDKTIPPGGEIENTQGSIDLMGLLSRFMFSSGSSGNSGSSNGASPGPAANAPGGNNQPAAGGNDSP